MYRDTVYVTCIVLVYAHKTSDLCNVVGPPGKGSGTGQSSGKPAPQPSSGSSIPKSKSETTGPLYAPKDSRSGSSAKGSQTSGKQGAAAQPSSGSELPSKKEETTGGRY